MSPNNGMFFTRVYSCRVRGRVYDIHMYGEGGGGGGGKRNKVTAFSFLVVVCEVECEELKSVA